MKPFRIAACALIAALMVMPAETMARTIDFGGGFRVQLPTIIRRKGTSTQSSAYASHARWSTVIDGAFTYATNGQGIWIGYDEQGAMVMQVEARIPRTEAQGTPLPVRVDINGRYYETVMSVVANEAMIVAHGPEVERILDRLMSGRTIRMDLGTERIETHLTGSSAAIREVRSQASVQRRMFAAGLVKPAPEPEQPEVEADPETGLVYYVPGAPGQGEVDVRFNIVEGAGLRLYVIFERIEELGDPEHSVPLTVSETARMIELIGKGEEWTRVAQENRVGLFSKRIGYVDDALNPSAGSAPGSVGAGQMQGPSPSASGGEASGEAIPDALTGAGQPRDFKAVSFNSYEDGTTSIQIEHSIGGFSRRFNLWMANALELAENLQSVMDYATNRLENREIGTDEVDQLFQ